MRRLNFILLYIWSALAFAAASKAQVNKPYGEWFKIGMRVAQQQPLPFDHPLVILYSGDLEASVEAVTAAGGTIREPIYAFPGGRRFHFADPAGNELAVWSDQPG